RQPNSPAVRLRPCQRSLQPKLGQCCMNKGKSIARQTPLTLISNSIPATYENTSIASIDFIVDQLYT
ncbi:hypothetical protein, partial [Massilia sp. AB1]|uniref:hypothetical protein n=1 Tax=Massilia sp. AB1 TaxID=2823371 RepID=UPI001B8243CA